MSALLCQFYVLLFNIQKNECIGNIPGLYSYDWPVHSPHKIIIFKRAMIALFLLLHPSSVSGNVFPESSFFILSLSLFGKRMISINDCTIQTILSTDVCRNSGRAFLYIGIIQRFFTLAIAFLPVICIHIYQPTSSQFIFRCHLQHVFTVHDLDMLLQLIAKFFFCLPVLWPLRTTSLCKTLIPAFLTTNPSERSFY